MVSCCAGIYKCEFSVKKHDLIIRFQNLFQNLNYFLDWPLFTLSLSIPKRIKFGIDLKKLINEEKSQLFLKLPISVSVYVTSALWN